MRYKVVPPARGRDVLWAVHDALPLVPGSVEDCCTRIRDRTVVPARDEAREWLTFARALGLAGESERGFHRSRDPPSEAVLPRRYVSRVYGVRELLRSLSSPGTATDCFEHAVEPLVPRWERHRHDDWRAIWTERTERLLAWGVAFGVLERVDGERYRRADGV